MYRIILIFCLAIQALVWGHEGVYVAPVEKTPNEDAVVTKIIFPRPYENKRKMPINVQMRIEKFPLGILTKNKRANEIYHRRSGQAIHVIIDNNPYISYNQTLEGNGQTLDQLLSFHIQSSLKPGQHVLRAFPVYSYGESVKGKGPFSAEIFYYQDKHKADTLNVDLQKPYLTYNEPQGKYPRGKSNPILLDFLLANCTLSQNGYKVGLTIDGKRIQMLTDYAPYYIYNLSPGKHLIKLELLDHNHQGVPGFFNVVEREIEIEHYIDSES